MFAGVTTAAVSSSNSQFTIISSNIQSQNFLKLVHIILVLLSSCPTQGSHYLLILKFKDFSTTLKFHFQGPILDGSLQHE